MTFRREDLRRYFCVVAAWPGRKPFMAGSFLAPLDAGGQMIEEEARRVAGGFFRDILPTDVRSPDILEIRAGMIFFIPADDQ